METLGDDYLVCRFAEGPDIPYRLAIYDVRLNPLFITSDDIMSLAIDGQRLAYILSDDGQGYLVEDFYHPPSAAMDHWSMQSP